MEIQLLPEHRIGDSTWESGVNVGLAGYRRAMSARIGAAMVDSVDVGPLESGGDCAITITFADVPRREIAGRHL